MHPEQRERCPDCQVGIGERHEEGCDVALCVVCGQQQLQCDPTEEHGYSADESTWPPMQTWTGWWPGEQECVEWGWFAHWTAHSDLAVEKGWAEPDTGSTVACAPDHPWAYPDLSRLVMEAAREKVVWSREQERYILPDAPSPVDGVTG